MVKKLHKSAEGSTGQSAGKHADKHLADNVKDSAQQIWLAGMGAFSRAQAEGGKMFETLMKEGLNLQRKTQGMAEDKIHGVTGKMTSMAGEVQAKAGQHWDKLETIFEQRTAKAMAKLGVPTAKDVEVLIQRVDELAAAVARLAGEPVTPKAKTARKTPTRTAAESAAPARRAARSEARATAKPTPAASRKRTVAK